MPAPHPAAWAQHPLRVGLRPAAASPQWGWAPEPRLFSAELAGARAFYPRMYTVAPAYSALSTPWFFDYAHLIFWFFFFATFVIVLWLAYFLTSVTHNVEARRPVRETRGFSRAQTGDGLTAALPLTWSVTMLLHASTHSANFDENTAATVFSFSVVAYQWGWNYYFPRDIVEVLAGAPRLVGRGNVECQGAGGGYDQLLAAARAEYASRLTARGLGAARVGRANAPSALAFFARPASLPVGGLEPFLGVYAPGAWRRGISQAPTASLAWAGLRPEEGVGGGLRGALFASRTLDHAYAAGLAPRPRRGALWCAGRVARPGQPFGLLSRQAAGQLGQVDLAAGLPLAANAARDRQACALVGNRLGLIHHHLASGAQLGVGFFRPVRQAALLAQLGAVGRAHRAFGAGAASWHPEYRTPAVPVAVANLGRDLWGATRVGFGGCRVGRELSRLGGALEAVLRPVPASVARLALLAPLGGGLEARGGLALARLAQQGMRNAPDLSLGGGEPALLSAEDLGRNAATPAQQVGLRAHGAGGRSAELQLQLTRARYPRPLQANRALWVTLEAGQPGQSAAGITALAAPLPGVLPGLRDSRASVILTALQARPVARLGFAAEPAAGAAGSAWAAHVLAGSASRAAAHRAAGLGVAASLAQSSAPQGRAAPAGAFQPTQPGSWLSPAVPPLGAPILCLTPLPQAASWALKGGTPAWGATAPLLPWVWAPHAGAQAAGAPGSSSVSCLWGVSVFAGGAALAAAHPLRGAGWPQLGWAGAPSPGAAQVPGADETRPISAPTPAFFEPASAAVRAEPGLLLLPKPAARPLFDWWWRWTSVTADYQLPLDKLFRARQLRRPLSGFWGHALWARPASGLAGEAELRAFVAKQARLWGGLRPEVRRLRAYPAYPELAPAALDAEWARGAPISALPTPGTYLDLDPAFLHRRWAAELNTSRRADHDARYRVTWGPFLAWCQGRGGSGPQGARGLTGQVARELALLGGAELGYKTAEGALPVRARQPRSQPAVGPAQAARLLGWVGSLGRPDGLAGPEARALHVAARRPLKGAGGEASPAWAGLWTFRQWPVEAAPSAETGQLRAGSLQWAARGLALLTLRAELAQQQAGRGTRPQPLTPAGGGRYGLVAALSTPARLPEAGGVPSAQPGLAGLAQGLESLVRELVVAGHPRSGFAASRDEIGAQRRLRVTKGLTLPADVPMHVMCGSKDVIHSWAIPGLGVKIDCIPGYNSHRRLLLRWRGAFWGQCMEVCGRYHHWMPILVRVVHKDIFVSWCLAYLRALEVRALAEARATRSLRSAASWRLALTVGAGCAATPRAALLAAL